MSLVSSRVTVTTSATLIAAADADDGAGLAVVVRVPTGGASIDVGSSSVASGAGFQLSAGEQFELTLRRGEGLYGVAASGSQVVHVLKVQPA